jgi:hypothetical protein
MVRAYAQAMPHDESWCRCLLCEVYEDAGPNRMSRTGQELLEHVRQRGWSTVRIVADDRRPGWAFTVALWHSFCAPDIAMFGLDLDVLGACVDFLAQECAEGRSPLVGTRRTGVLDGHPVHLGRIHDSWRNSFVGTALGFYRATPGVPMLQLVWPDHEGRFPDESGASPSCREDQPELSLALLTHPNGIWTR